MRNFFGHLLVVTNLIKGGCFANINGYTNDSGEVADHRINLGMNYGKAKADDYKTVCEAIPTEIALKTNFPIETVIEALTEMRNSLNPDAPQTVRGKAQTDAYTIINGCVKLHEETGFFHIYAYRMSKKVLVEGVYKQVNSSPKTLCKKAIQKALDLKTSKYGQYKISSEKFEAARILGNELSL
jgi:hypothetical protein